MSNVIVIGGGASGMMAAIAAARNGKKVTIIEQQSKLGRKILSTGNGRCNFTNTYQAVYCYNSSNPSFPFDVYLKFPVDRTIAFFDDIGVYPKDRERYIYPNSNQASSVVDNLIIELNRLGVEIITNAKCQEILTDLDGFKVHVDYLDKEVDSSTIFVTDKVILTTGGKAASVLGSDGSGYELAKSLGHSIIPVLPSLVQLRCQESFYKKLSGLRVQGMISLMVDGEMVAYDIGEIQLTDYGISGIPVFQISGKAAKSLAKGRRVEGIIDFVPDMQIEQLNSYLKNRIDSNPNRLNSDFLIGLLPRKLSDLLISLCNINPTKKVRVLSSNDLKKMATLIKSFRTTIIATNSFDKAQICSGGVDTREVCPDTMESLIVKGLYFAGEVLDVDGLCGGYNLQWAWSSGYVGGMNC